MTNFCVDAIAPDDSIRHRTWFKTREEAMSAADNRRLPAPVFTMDRLVVMELKPVHFIDAEAEV